MIEMNRMHSEVKEETSLVYKISRGFLMLVSSILMLYFLVGIVRYITSGPSVTLLDDLTTDFIVQIILMGLGMFYLIVAWFRHISYGIVSLIFTFLYVGYSALLTANFSLGFLPIAMSLDAVGFIILGLVKKHKKKNEYNVYADPIVNEYQGPNVFNFRV